MSIFVDENTKVVYQGLTGSQGRFYGLLNQAYGTQVVAGTGIHVTQNQYTLALSQPLFRWDRWETFEQSKLQQAVTEAQFAQAQHPASQRGEPDNPFARRILGRLHQAELVSEPAQKRGHPALQPRRAHRFRRPVGVVLLDPLPDGSRRGPLLVR